MTRMVDDPDIWRAANLLLKRYAADAEIVAAARADELLAGGDLEGYAVRKMIHRTMVELTREPAEGERTN